MAFPTKEMIHLNISWICYILWGFGVSFVVRLILCIFRALMPKATVGSEEDKSWPEKPFIKRYVISFHGFDTEAGDYWLPFIIGAAEVLAYPILFHFDQVAVIGGWIALKTAGQWGVWQKRRPTLYSFLLGNIIIISFSYFLMTKFINP